MNQERTLFILLILVASLAVLFAGCTSQTQEKPAPNLPTTAHAERTLIPTVTTSPAPEETAIPVSTASVPVETPANSAPASGEVSFANGGISLSYPDRFNQISSSSLEKMRTVAEQGGINILTILTATDSKDSIQVTRQDADATIEGMFNEKMAISREVAVNGSANVVAMTFIKYDVVKLALADGTGVVKVTAENSDKGTAVTYLLCKPGVVYNVNFIYDSPERAESQASVRDTVMQSVHLD